MNSKRALLALATISALALTACGGAKSAPQPAAVQPAAVTATQSSLEAGVAQMRQVLTDTQKAVAAGDTAKAQLDAKAVDEAWESFEDQVKVKNKDLYGKVEEQLQALQAAVKPEQIDTKLASEIAGKLSSLLDDLLK